MMRIPGRIALVTLVFVSSVAAQDMTMQATARFDDAVAATRVMDVDGDGRDELLVIFRDGRVRHAEIGKGETKLRGTLDLPDPSHCLLDIARITEDARPQLIVLDGEGTHAYSIGEGGTFAEKGVRLARRARLRLRTGWPRWSAIVQDSNGDGLDDLVVPLANECELWLQKPGDGGPSFVKSASVHVRVEVDTVFEPAPGVDELLQNVTVPDLDIRDVNGDGRRDLVVSRSNQTRFHRQRDDGSIPFEPDVILDLDRFRDTTPKADIRPGRTLAGTEKALRVVRDLDGDGIPDYVIAHRRKVWVFQGTKDGPQFVEPSTILKTSDDITGVWLSNIDDDGRLDLLIVRVEVPSFGTLITGMLGSFSIDIRAVGYRNVGGKGFDRKPAWRRSLNFTLPSLDEVMRNPDAIFRRIEDASKSFRSSVMVDLDGDGNDDLGLVDPDESRIDVWFGRAGVAAEPQDVDAILNDILFKDEDSDWDVDRLVEWIENLGAREFTRLTDGKDPALKHSLRDGGDFFLLELLEGDMDGDGDAEIVVVYRPRGTAARVVDVIARP